MKNHFLFALLLILCLPCSYAQQNLPPNVSIMWSAPFKIQTSAPKLVTSDKDSFYMLRNKFAASSNYKVSTAYLELYNDSLKRVATGKVPENDKKEYNPVVSEVVNLADKTYLFSVHSDNKAMTTYHYAQSIDLKSMHINNDEKKIGEKKMMIKRENYDFKYRVSGDRRKLLVLVKQSEIEKTPQQYIFQVFDADLNLLWTKDMQMKDENTFLYNFNLDNEGNAYAMTRTYRDDKEKESDKPLCMHTVIGYFDQGKTQKIHHIQEEGEFTYDADMYLMGEGKILISSFFIEDKELKEKKKTAIVPGFVVTTVDLKNEKVIKEGFSKLDSIRGLLIGRGIVRREDGGFIAIAQDYYDSLPKSFVKRELELINQANDVSYGREDLLLMGISPDHKVEWHVRVNRPSLTSYFTTMYSTASTSAMFPFIYKDKLYLIFNGLVSRKSGSHQSALWMVSVDANGRTERCLLSDKDVMRVFIEVPKCFSLSKNEVILYVENTVFNSYWFARLRFE